VEDEELSEDDERLEVVDPRDYVEGDSVHGGASIEPTCHGFDKPPGYMETHLRTQLRMEKGWPFRRHPRPPGTPIPPRRKSAQSSSQPVQRVRPLQLVSTSSSQPEVCSHTVGA
jgi:hypothetical protein